MKKKSEGPFRKALADFIRRQRKLGITNKVVKKTIYPFCCGWTALSNEMDKVFVKYETSDAKTTN